MKATLVAAALFACVFAASFCAAQAWARGDKGEFWGIDPADAGHPCECRKEGECGR